MTFTTIIAGARVTSVVGTSEQSALVAQDALKRHWKLLVNPYESISAAVSEENADVVVVCTPW